jgi:hypothetical protein
VEPDNSGRYWYSSSPLGARVFALASAFFSAVATVRGEAADLAVGPRVIGRFAACGIHPVSVQLFPVSVSHIGPLPATSWQTRRDAVTRALSRVPNAEVGRLGAEYLQALTDYEQDSARAGATFVEIQNTMLFATVGERNGQPLKPELTNTGAQARDRQ